MSVEPLLEVADLSAGYAGSQVLFGLSFSIGTGEAATLIGRNGMGKTTAVRSLLGLLPARGRVRLGGRDITGLPAHRIARLGVAVVPEGRQIFPNLSVEENLVAFAANRSGSTQPWTLARVYGMFPRLRERRGNLGNQLSGGEQQMLAIGRALMTNPRLLILDEATEGLAPLIREDIWRCLAALRGTGLTLLVIDKYVEQLIELADHHTIIERGRVAWQGRSEELSERRDLWHRYLGV